MRKMALFIGVMMLVIGFALVSTTLGACRRTPNNFVDSVDCSLKIEKSW